MPAERADVAGFVSWLGGRAARELGQRKPRSRPRRAAPRQEAAHCHRRRQMTCPESSPHSHASLSEPSAWVERFAPLVAGRARARSRVRARPPCALTCRARRERPRRRPRRGGAPVSRNRAHRDRVADLESGEWPFAASDSTQSSSRTICIALFPALLRALADDGVLLYETFARGNEAYGRPTNPDFLLEQGRAPAPAQGR
jgi:hypothetical protein